MRRKRNVRVGEAWQTCALCGMDFPMSELRVSQSEQTAGQWVCEETCVDNTDVERKERAQARVLSTGAPHEGADTRDFGRRFFGVGY